MSSLEMKPELQGHGSVTRFLRAALFRKCPLSGRHSVLVTSGGGGGSLGRMWIMEANVRSPTVAKLLVYPA